MTVGSLFSGIGGLDLGLEWAGFETKWFCEIEKFPQAVLRKHWPHVPIIEDVRDVKPSESVQRVDVIAGGFPCQDISWAGKGRGIDYDLSEQEGTRSGLWWEMWRVIRDLRPRYVVAENVPALTHRGLDIVLGSLAEIGYDAEWQTISAAGVGAPHIRERVFIVAYPNNKHGRWKERGGVGGGVQGKRGESPEVGSTKAGNVAHGHDAGLEGREGVQERGGQRTAREGGSQPDWFGGPIGQPWPVSFKVGDTTILDVESNGAGAVESEADSGKRSGKHRRTGSGSGDWVEVEYPVCGMADGISEELDKGIINGKPKKERPAEELRVLRESDDQKTLRGKAGGQECVSSEKVLQPCLCELKESNNCGSQPPDCEGASEKGVRNLRYCRESASASCGPQPDEQRSRKHQDHVRLMPHEIALAAVEKGWVTGEANKPWVEVEVSADGSVDGVSDRVGQLKGYGNAVVPQVGYLVGRAIMEREKELGSL